MRISFVRHGLSFLVLSAFVFLALGSGTTETAVTETETAQTHYDRGRQHSEKKDWKAAISEFSRAIELDPNFELAYANRAVARANLENFSTALKDINKAIEMNPTLVDAYRLRGQIHTKIGEESVSSFREAFFGGDIDEYTKAIEEYDLALADFNKEIELNPQSQERIDQLITAVQQKKEQAEAQRADLIARNTAREEANRYDPANFIIVPNNFIPANYTRADLFDAAATAGKLEITAPNIFGQYYTPSEDFVSDVVFVNQNGTSITFRTADNAISRTMQVDSRTGLSAGQRVRIYYSVYRIIDWHIDAIERL
jgi:tetratricopeptide (TPR) repeat protein